MQVLLRYSALLIGFVPPVLILLYENHQLTGNWLRFAQDLVGSYDTPGFGPGHGDPVGHTPSLGVHNTLIYFSTLATMFNGWPAPLSMAPVALGAYAWLGDRAGEVRRKLFAWDALLWLCWLGLVGAYFLWWSATTIFGPRYWYEGMPFLLLIAGRGMDLLGKLGKSIWRDPRGSQLRWLVPGVLFAVFTLYALTQSLPFGVSTYTDYNGISPDAVRNVENAHLTNALVFVALEPSRPNRDYGKVFFANDPLLQGNVVYARDLGAARNKGLLPLFPGRQAYYLPLHGPPQPGFGP